MTSSSGPPGTAGAPRRVTSRAGRPAQALAWPLGVALAAAAAAFLAGRAPVLAGGAATVLAVGSCAAASRSAVAGIRRMWSAVAAAVGLWAVSAALAAEWGHSPWWLATRLLAVVCLLAAFVWSPGVARSRDQWVLLLLDGFMIAGSVVLAVLNLTVRPAATGQGVPSAAVGPLVAVLLALGCASLLLGLACRVARDVLPTALMLVLVGGLASAAEIIDLLAHLSGEQEPPVVPLRAAAAAALALTPWADRNPFASAAPRPGLPAMAKLPHAFVTLSVSLGVVQALRGRPVDLLVGVLGLSVLIAAIAQVVLLQRENRSLYDDIAAQASRFRSLLQESSDIVMTCTLTSRVTYVTPSVRRVLGYSPEEFEGTKLFDITHPDDRTVLVNRVRAMVTEPEQGVPLRARVRAADGGWRYLESTASLFREHDSASGLILNTRDVTERVELEAQLQRRAAYDPLTGLLNRAAFTDHLSRVLGVNSASGTFAVFFLDLDDFKSVNDTAGHAAGDVLLAVAASRVRDSLRDTDLVARFGGDEFVALVSGSDADEILEVARRLRRVLALPHDVGGRHVVMAASIGVAFVTPGASADDLLRNADLAMYRAKRNGRNRYEVYESQMHVDAVERVELAGLLRQAVENEALTLHYQPIVDLDTGGVRHLEALLRWQRPDGTYVPPSVFVPVAEDCGLIGQIGDWVLRTALLQLAAWRCRALDVGVAVNLSARQLVDPGLVGAVATALAASGVPAHALMLEITENVLVDSTDAPRTLAELRALGVEVALDDFGTGFSSLGYLGRLPVDTLKVDRTFVAALSSDPDATVLLRTMVNLGTDLGLAVVAEGVETAEELAALRALGYRCAQGFLLARPLPVEAVEDRLRAGFADTCTVVRGPA